MENNGQTNPIKEGAYSFTQRELQVLKLIVDGKTNRKIAQEMYLSTHMVKVHVASILVKMNVKHRLQAAVKAVNENIINN